MVAGLDQAADLVARAHASGVLQQGSQMPEGVRTALAVLRQPSEGGYGKVVGSLLDHGARCFPWHTIRPPADDLVVAYNFAPFADASAITATKRVVAAGSPVDVVSHDLHAIRRTDDTLGEMVAPFVGINHRTSGETTFNHWRSIAAFVSEASFRLGPTGSRPYRRCYSRSMWPHSHFLAGAVKLSNPNLEWTAEFSDPARRDVDGVLRPTRPVPFDDPLAARLLTGVPARWQKEMLTQQDTLSWCQLLPFALADRLVFTNDQQRTAMLEDIDPALRDDVMRRSDVSPHPTPGPVYYRREEHAAPRSLSAQDTGSAVRLAYFGTFYANRGMAELLEAMAAMRYLSEHRLELHVFSDRAEALVAASVAAGISDAVTVHQPLPYLTSLAASRNFDVLVLNDTRTSGYTVANPFLPSKLSDYAGAGVPVLGLVASGSTLDRYELDYRAEIGDVQTVVAVLRQLIEDRPTRS